MSGGAHSGKAYLIFKSLRLTANQTNNGCCGIIEQHHLHPRNAVPRVFVQ